MACGGLRLSTGHGDAEAQANSSRHHRPNQALLYSSRGHPGEPFRRRTQISSLDSLTLAFRSQRYVESSVAGTTITQHQIEPYPHAGYIDIVQINNSHEHRSKTK